MSRQGAASLVLSALSARCWRMGLIFIAVDPENKRLMALGFKDKRLVALNIQSRLFLQALKAGHLAMRVTRPLVLNHGVLKTFLLAMASSFAFQFLIATCLLWALLFRFLFMPMELLRLFPSCCWVRLELKVLVPFYSFCNWFSSL